MTQKNTTKPNKMTSRILLSFEVEQFQQLSENHLDYVKITGEIITVQEYIRRILVARANKL